jgi:hypothetical protein
MWYPKHSGSIERYDFIKDEERHTENQQLDLAGVKTKNFCLNTRQLGSQCKNINTRNYFKSQ